jgi:hypothetical protein
MLPLLKPLSEILTYLLLAGLVAALPAAAGERPPLVIGGSDVFDACSANGRVVGLDPFGDNYSSVRSGPGGRPYDEKDRIHTGQVVWACGQDGPWIKIVYLRGSHAACGVHEPWPVGRAYTGPCRWGWVHQKYIDIFAG